jgi:hypothetical protein
MGRVKLVFLIRSLGVGGAEHQLVELAKDFDHNVFDVNGFAFTRRVLSFGELLSAVCRCLLAWPGAF